MHLTRQRAGEALRRSPYAWLIATLAVFVVMLSPLSALGKDSEEASIGYAAVLAGAQQWSLSAGFASTIVLLVVAARAIRRSPVS